MSFRATITKQDHQIIWFRTVYVLSTLNEEINITLTSESMILWGMNDTDTSLCQVVFERKFFSEFEFNANEIVFGELGLQMITDASGGDHKIYSFKTKSKHLTTISKKPDNDVIKRYTLNINNTSTCSEAMANRLLVSVEMDSLIVKEYSPQFTPIEYDPIIINLKYKKKFLDVYSTAPTPESPLDPRLRDIFINTEREISNALFNDNLQSGVKDSTHLAAEDEINYICCMKALIVNFIESCNASVTEEVKLDVDVNKLVITAFTKAIYGKNNDLLRNSISVSNTIGTGSLEHYCLFTTMNDETDTKLSKRNQAKTITFKLKDFRNFISITSSIRINGQANNDCINIWFCQPGDPVLLEIKRPGVRLELYQVTEGSSTINNDIKHDMSVAISISPDKKRYERPLTKSEHKSGDGLLKVSPLKKDTFMTTNPRQAKQRSVSSTRGVLANWSSQKKTPNVMRKLFMTDSQEDTDAHQFDLNNDSLKNNNAEAEFQQHSRMESPALVERSGTTIGWGKRPNESIESENEKYSTAPKFPDSEAHSNTNHEKANEIKKKKSKLSENEDGLGPTQQVHVKGLFD